MRLVIQRVKSSSISVNGGEPQRIGRGLCVLFCAGRGDTMDLIPKLAEKTAKLRIFEDENGKMNLSALDLGLSALVAPNFTLLADTSHGKRPSFIAAAEPSFARAAFEEFVLQLKSYGFAEFARGEFGADMLIDIENDGPVTIVMDTEDWKK